MSNVWDIPEKGTQPTPVSEAPESSKQEPLPKQKAPTKRKYPFKSRQNSGKRTLATFSKKPEIKSTSCFLLHSSFEIATSFLFVHEVTNTFHDLLRTRDAKIADALSRREFHYVILLALYYRCAVVATKHYHTIIPDISELKLVAENTLLPEVICQYIEAFGAVKLTNEATVVPLFRTFEEMTELPGFVNPATVLDRISADNEEVYDRSAVWSVSTRIFLKYSNAISRVLKNAINLRMVNYNESEGRAEFLAVYQNDSRVGREARQIRVEAIDKIDEYQAQLGAAYKLRTPEMLQANGTHFPSIYGAPSTVGKTFLVAHFLRSLRGADA